MCVITHARYFPVEGAEDEEKGSDEEESESKVPKLVPAESPFDTEAGNLEIEKQENAAVDLSVLSSPPGRKDAASGPTSVASWSPPS